MRIYAVADIHSKADRIKQIKETIDRFRPKIMIIAGDIVNFTRPEQVIRKLSELKIPILAISGNTDPSRMENLFKGDSYIKSIDKKPFSQDGTTFVGISGTTPLPFLSKICLREKKALEKIKPLLKTPAILVTHTPPRGTLDMVAGTSHAGSIVLRDFIRSQQPNLLLCGHIHEAAGVDKIGQTTVVNCAMNKKGAGAVIDIKTDSEKSCRKTDIQIKMINFCNFDRI